MKIRKIFLHGWSFSREIWKDFFDQKNSFFLDLPFHNGNNNFDNKSIIESFTDQIIYQIDKSSQDVLLVGWSLGATLSVLTALKKPKRLKKLVLIGFSPKFSHRELGHDPVYIKAFMIALKKRFSQTVFNFRKTAVGKEFKDIPIPEKEGSIRLLKEFIDLDLTYKLSEIDLPVVLIHGKKDRIINYKGSVYASKKIVDSKLILTESDHAPFLKDSNVLMQELNY